MDGTPIDAYRARAAAFEAAAEAEARRSRTVSRLRLATAAVIVAALVVLVRDVSAWAAALAAFGVVVFVWLVRRHDRIEQRRDAAGAMAALNRDGLARVARSWDALPAPWTPPVPDDHPFAVDLDVFGHASLAQVLGPVPTPTGRRTLSGWLLDPAAADLEAIGARQQAVRELAPALDFRQQAATMARRLSGTSTDTSGALPHVLRWAEAPDAFARRAWLPWVATTLGVVTVAGAIAAYLGAITAGWWMLTGAIGWVVRWALREPVEQAFGGASGEQGLRPWATLLAHVAEAPFTSPLLAQARADLGMRDAGGTQAGSASHALRSLEQLVALSDVRHAVWLYVPLQTLTLWDLHAWWAIERWRRRHGADVRRWLDAVGRVDALSALASIAYEHPDWAWPEFDGGLDRISAAAVGHPLLPDAVRVGNDLSVGPPGRFVLITGSNMSGKSTLLRAIGLNVVLAHAGGPACAARFRLPPLTLHTSMRVSDSLERGLSLFMASLVRLQQVVAAARAASPVRRVCYLLDEVLQGTNSAERQVAVRTVMAHLLRCEAIGAVTTHDLELAADPSFAAHADSFHLQETLVARGDDVTMTFDYRLRQGPARAGNALQLLRLIGLAEGAPDEPAADVPARSRS